ncbi:GNAT family N-acetyltransferase [Arthrobacter echini]|uniref:GNAT family N-acetyltransferase n=1 Tax=Arthrobacter echini TaxID=1529066 RepID=A0A4S5DZZ3_9MICC|nr:GNAT family N-acetyltransferase [Arthrobacter echini]THJ64601.1 GNAT family N-acetyltransferase [Arthrobacter echini]
MIRLAQEDDIRSMMSIERAADAVFRDIGMAAIADAEPMPADALHGYQRSDRAWVDTDDLGRVVAYLLLEVLDGVPHIEQVSVHPSYAGQGKGRQLIEAVAEWAGLQGFSSLTLTTFTEVPWNAPYYARLGFEAVPASQLSPGLRHVRAHETAIGLDEWPRTAMRRALSN